jgi:hypothetical protein
MNRSHPSFLRLFRRSHYCRLISTEDESGEAEAEREEREGSQWLRWRSV